MFCGTKLFSLQVRETTGSAYKCKFFPYFVVRAFLELPKWEKRDNLIFYCAINVTNYGKPPHFCFVRCNESHKLLDLWLTTFTNMKAGVNRVNSVNTAAVRYNYCGIVFLWPSYIYENELRELVNRESAQMLVALLISGACFCLSN